LVTVLSKESFAVTITDTDDSWLSVYVIGDSVFDPVSGSVFVTFRTVSAWPYSLDENNIGGTQWTSTSYPPVIDENVGLTTVTRDYTADVFCPGQPGSSCTQQWVATINSDGVCNIQGIFQMNDTLLCRDTEPKWGAGYTYPGLPCNFTGSGKEPAPAIFQFNVGKTFLCDEEALDTSTSMTYQLLSYSDADFARPTTTFQTGDMIYMQFILTNPSVSVEAVTFNLITLVSGATSNTIYSVPEPFATGQWLSGINGEFLSEVRTLVPSGQPAVLEFGFQLSRSQLSSITVLGDNEDDDSISLLVQVSVDILYHGNNKRAVMVNHELNTASISEAAVITIMENDMEADYVDIDFFGSSASATTLNTLTILCALLLLVIFA
jgi:hypothetical protein